MGRFFPKDAASGEALLSTSPAAAISADFFPLYGCGVSAAVGKLFQIRSSRRHIAALWELRLKIEARIRARKETNLLG
jgi:hypothetical protein